jgi:hypothetical protein
LDNFAKLDAKPNLTNNKSSCHQRSHNTTLWNLQHPHWTLVNPLKHQLTQPTNGPHIQQQCNNAYQTKNITELITFLHAAAFSQIPSTWIAASQKDFSNHGQA